MKKFLLTLAAAALLTGPAMAEETLDLAFNNWPTTNNWTNSYAEHSWVADNFTFTMTAAAKQTGTITNIPVVKKSDMIFEWKGNETFEKVTFNFEQWATKTQTANIYYSLDGTNYTQINNSPVTVSSTLSISTEDLPENVRFVKASTTISTNQIGVASITYSLLSGSTDQREDPELSFSCENTTANLGQAFDAPSFTNPYNVAPIIWSSIDENVATVADGNVTILNAGTTEIKAAFDGDDTYKSGYATYTLTVIDPNAPIVAFKCSFAADEITSTNTYTSTATATTDGFQFEVQNFNTNNNGWGGIIKCGPKASTKSEAWISTKFVSPANITEISIDVADRPNGTVDSISVFTSDNGTDWSETPNAKLEGDVPADTTVTMNTSIRAGQYIKVLFITTNTTSKNAVIGIRGIKYFEGELVIEKQEAGLSFENETITIELDSEFVSPVLQNPNELDVVWLSSNPEVADINQNGQLSLAAVGTTTIKVYFAGNEEFLEGEASYVLTVIKPVEYNIVILDVPGDEGEPISIVRENENNGYDIYASEESVGSFRMLYDNPLLNPFELDFYTLTADDEDLIWESIDGSSQYEFYGEVGIYPFTVMFKPELIGVQNLYSFSTLYDNRIIIHPDVEHHFSFTDIEWKNASVEMEVEGEKMYRLLHPNFEEKNPNGEYTYYYMVNTHAQNLIRREAEAETEDEWIEYDHNTGIILPEGTHTVILNAAKNGVMALTPKFIEVNTADLRTGISAIKAENGEAVYFDMMGRRVAEPTDGIFIKVQNGKASKVSK